MRMRNNRDRTGKTELGRTNPNSFRRGPSGPRGKCPGGPDFGHGRTKGEQLAVTGTNNIKTGLRAVIGDCGACCRPRPARPGIRRKPRLLQRGIRSHRGPVLLVEDVKQRGNGRAKWRSAASCRHLEWSTALRPGELGCLAALHRARRAALLAVAAGLTGTGLALRRSHGSWGAHGAEEGWTA